MVRRLEGALSTTLQNETAVVRRRGFSLSSVRGEFFQAVDVPVPVACAPVGAEPGRLRLKTWKNETLGWPDRGIAERLPSWRRRRAPELPRSTCPGCLCGGCSLRSTEAANLKKEEEHRIFLEIKAGDVRHQLMEPLVFEERLADQAASPILEHVDVDEVRRLAGQPQLAPAEGQCPWQRRGLDVRARIASSSSGVSIARPRSRSSACGRWRELLAK